MARTARHVIAPRKAEQPRGRRLTAEARKRSILKAARRAFSETGDMNGTTMRTIADRAGISEGVIYRHFESKDQLFYEAVVEPLRSAVDSLVAAAEQVDSEGPLTPERQVETLTGLYRQLTSTFEDVLPLLGLVLFGDPKVASRFYSEHFSEAMRRMSSAWADVEARHGVKDASTEIAARVVMGVSLLLALEAHHDPKGFDRDRVVERISEGTRRGFFPTLGTSAKKR